jgi:tetratricopeptide (TPR) repeat protein
MNRLRNLLAISLFGLFCSCGTEDKKDPRQLLEAPPYAGITDSIRQFPKNAALYSERATMLSQTNQHELATADYKMAWELKPDENIALLYINNLLMINKPNEAVRLLKECVAAYPGNTDMHRRLSEIYAATGQSSKAVEQYNELLEQDSLNFETWYEKGRLLSQLNDTAGAILALERSYAIQPLNTTGLTLANLYAAMLSPKTLAFCDSLLARDTSTVVDVLYAKGVYYSDTKQHAKALELFEECIKRDWKFADAYIEKGLVLFEQKKYENALDVFTMAATVSNTLADAYYWMGRCYEATGKKELALVNYQRTLALDRNFTEAMDHIKGLKD